MKGGQVGARNGHQEDDAPYSFGGEIDMPETTDLVWLDNLTPKSTRFDDTYYSRENGLDETRYVFIDGNDLTSRWQRGEQPVIGELGFGTGLNFLATWHAWRARQSVSPLRFLSVEKYPLSCDQLGTALTPWPELAPLAEQLAGQWQPDETGWQTLSFGTATLQLFIGEATDALSAWPLPVDAWYLDGFNPKTNPDLWSLELMQALHTKSNMGATLASYTAAGWVRRNLQASGFAIEKRKGFGHKRDMITGQKT